MYRNRDEAKGMYQQAVKTINEEAGSGSVREEQARGAMVVLGHLIGIRKLDPAERRRWLGEIR